MLDQQRLAADLIGSVLAGRNLNDSLNQTFKTNPQLQTQERAAIQDISFGALRHLGLLQAVLARLARQSPQPAIEHLLVAALYQLEFTRAAPYAIVDHAVRLAGELSRGKAGGFVNACLRRFLREREALLNEARRSLEGKWSFPKWWIESLQQTYPAQWESILSQSNSHPPMTLRVNRRRATAQAYLEELAALGIAGGILGDQAIRLQTPTAVDRLPGFFDGRASVQDWGAQQAAPLLDLREGQRVLDACAAPGGKTGHILELADVELLALDADAGRLKKVEQNLDRLGLRADVKRGDAGEPEQWWDGRPFDRILADVPCSASGVTRRHPDIKWLRRPDDLATFSRQQKKILTALWKCLAPGGKIIYSTCSLFKQENEQQVESFLQQTPEARRIEVKFPGMVAGQLLPDDVHDGFYYAVLEKLPI